MKSFYNFLLSKGQTGALLLGLIVIAIFLFSVMSGLSSEGYDMSTDLNKLDDSVVAGISFFNPGLFLAMALVFIAFIAAVIFGVVGIIKFPKSSTRALIAIGVLAVVFFLFYSMSATEFAAGSKMSTLIQKFDLSDGIVKFIGGGINVTIVLAMLTVAIGVIFEIKNAFN